MSDTKQVIVVRKDLNMRRGKQIAQSCHASLAFLTNALKSPWDGHMARPAIALAKEPYNAEFSPVVVDWLENSYKKICVYVNSEAELLKIKDDADNAGLECHLITDSGLTEFHGVPTKTCLAIGPDYSDEIDKITGHLTLL